MPIRLEDDDVSIPDYESGRYGRNNHHNEFTKIINCIRVFNIPIINFLIIGVLGVFLIKLTAQYLNLYLKSALVTIIVTNLVLYGISETLAQSIMSYSNIRPPISFDLNEPYSNGIGLDVTFSHQNNMSLSNPRAINRLSLNNDDVDYTSEGDEEGLERFIDFVQDDQDSIDEVGFDEPFPNTIPYVPLSYFKFNRLAGFMSWGLIMAFVQRYWYSFLQIYSKDPKFIEVLRKVLTDQLCFSPISLFCFFTYGTIILDSGTWEETKVKLSRVYIKTLMINYSVWVPVQFINFLFVPRNFQVPFSSSVSVLWNCFLSMRNSKTQV